MAGAILAAASAAQAGIVIPAGDWTLDVSGNVNAYDIYSRVSGNNSVVGGLAGQASTPTTTSGIQNGLLPNFLSFSGSTRQNDLDVSFTISLQPGTGNNAPISGVGDAGNGGLNNRQAFITFGDKSWGSVKLGKDLGIFASDAILSDMTLLGVGATSGGSTSGGNTTLGRIGVGYIYADWKPQIAYTTPNFSGFQATAGITQAFQSTGSYTTDNSTVSSYLSIKQANPAYEGKASYSFDANGVAGKVWVSGIAQHVATSYVSVQDPMAYAGDVGIKLDYANAQLVAYYYGGSGVGTTGQMENGYGYSVTGANGAARDSYGGYVQATYVLPTKTKIGLSWGESNLDKASGEAFDNLVKTNEMWTAGIYHPLTKHLNLVAEYSNLRSTNQINQENKANIGSVGAILFF